MTPRVLIIAGSDSSGGAGIQADIKTVTMLGGYAATAVTAVTVQNTLGVSAVHAIPAEVVAAQMRAVIGDIGVDAVKIGMLGDADVIAAVAEVLRGLKVPIVLDPVMVAKGGASLLADDAVEALVRYLLPLSTIVTPNTPELAALTGTEVDDEGDAVLAAQELLGLGARAVLAKGGHLAGDGERPDAVRLAPDRHPPHPRHRLHAGIGDRGWAGARRAAGGSGRGGAGVCVRRDRACSGVRRGAWAAGARVDAHMTVV